MILHLKSAVSLKKSITRAHQTFTANPVAPPAGGCGRALVAKHGS